jgi:uncharacterized repeat protein (TIGR04076 family)
MGEWDDILAQEESNETKEALAAIMNAVNKYYHEVTITGVTGPCPYGHTVGEKFKVTGMNHDCLCGSLYQSILGHILTSEYGGSVPWEDNVNIFTGVCPEMQKVQVEVKRFEQEKPVYVRTRTDSKVITGKGPVCQDKYRIYLEIIDRQNHCMWGHIPGQKFEVDLYNIGKVCGSLYKSAYPFISLLMTGNSPPWEGEDNIIHGTCPDPYDLVSYRLIREER